MHDLLGVTGKTTAAGYGADHQSERRRWQKRLDAGEVVQCSRQGQHYCPGTPIDPTNWELDHTDDRTGYLGPAHPPCNRYAGAAKGDTMIIREW